jgi:hypothetical protein
MGQRVPLLCPLLLASAFLGGCSCEPGVPAEGQKPEAGVKVSGLVYFMAAGEVSSERVKRRAAGAAVHLRDLPAGWDATPPADPVRLQFREGRLRPEFACLQVGQELVVKAPEGETFALRAVSRERGRFGAVVPPDPKVFTARFPRPDDFVLVTCALHPTAKAHLQVVPTPGFALCDGEGRFRLPRRLPKGRHVLKGFLPGRGWGEKAITLRGDEGAVAVELELTPRSKAKSPGK